MELGFTLLFLLDKSINQSLYLFIKYLFATYLGTKKKREKRVMNFKMGFKGFFYEC